MAATAPFEFARCLPVWVRFVLVPEPTDEPGDIAQITRFAAPFSGDASVPRAASDGWPVAMRDARSGA